MNTNFHGQLTVNLNIQQKHKKIRSGTEWHEWSPVNLLHIFRASFPKNTSEGLLLNVLSIASLNSKSDKNCRKKQLVFRWVSSRKIFTFHRKFIEFPKLRAFVPYVPSCLTCLRALRTFTPSYLTCLCAFVPYVPWFLRTLITRLARLNCYLRALLTRDIYSSQVVSVFSELMISMDMCLLLLYLSSSLLSIHFNLA